MFFNEKGQAFDVFKLLIAAVVAVVILTLLLSIIGQIGIIGQGVPATEAKTIIKDVVTNRTTPQTSKKVTFGPNASTINSSGIAEGSDGGITEDQVCLSAGDFIDQIDTWETTGNKIRVTYKGSALKPALLHAICGVGKDIANGVNGEDFFERYDPDLQLDWFDGCKCIDSDFEETCCVIAVKKAT